MKPDQVLVIMARKREGRRITVPTPQGMSACGHYMKLGYRKLYHVNVYYKRAA